jgi:acyl-CoA synthetase (AMP-forming)/AMP-acid ligase II
MTMTHVTGARPANSIASTPTPTLSEAFCTHAVQQPDAPAFVWRATGEWLTYGLLHQRACRVAARLRAAAPADGRALVMLPAGLHSPAAYLGCLFAGVVAVPVVYPEAKDLDRIAGPLGHMVQDCGARVILTDRSVMAQHAAGEGRLACLDRLDIVAIEAAVEGKDDGAPPHQVKSSDPAHILYTSGSTSPAKGVILSHGAVAHNLRYTSERWGFGRGDRHATFGVLYHSAGIMVGYLMPLFIGATSVLMTPEMFASDPIAWLHALAEHRVTHTACGNGAIDRLLAALARERARPARIDGLDLSAWRVAVIGGEPLHPSTLDELGRLCGPLGFALERVVTAYGMTEAAGLITTSHRDRAPSRVFLEPRALIERRVVLKSSAERPVKIAITCGTPSHGVTVEIVDPETHRICPPGKVGEVWYSSPSLFDGYLGLKPSRQLSALAGTQDARYLRSGDAGLVVEEELFILGRLKELIVRKGRWLYPQEIEWVAEGADPGLAGFTSMVFSLAGEDEVVLAQEVPSHLAATPAALDRLADMIRAHLGAHFGDCVDRIVLLHPGTLPWVYTSAKKPRLLACSRYQEGALSVLRAYELHAPAMGAR